MNNPFEKKDHKLLIAGIVIGAFAAGAAAYLFLTEKGSALRDELSAQLDQFLGKVAEPDSNEDAQAYLHHDSKAPKTDREALRKHNILHEPGAENVHHEEEQQS